MSIQFFRDLPATELDLKTIEHTLEQSRVRFKRYYETGRALTTDLKSALIKYYETIINFVVEMHGEFSRGRTSASPIFLILTPANCDSNHNSGCASNAEDKTN